MILGTPLFSEPLVYELTSSDPTVLSVPASLTVPPNTDLVSATFTALKRGAVTITATSRFRTTAVTIQVLGPDEAARIAPFLGMRIEDVGFGRTATLHADVYGVAGDGSRPTGTVTFYDDGQPLATVPVINGKALHTTTVLRLGTHFYSAVYDGDPKFVEWSLPPQYVFVYRGIVSLDALRSDGSGAVKIVATGAAGYPPTGSVAVDSGSSQALAPSGDATASATIGGIAASARTLTVTYTGDTHYEPLTITIPILYSGPRARSVRH